MAKASKADIQARLAKGECANYLSGSCQGRIPCAVINGDSCQYFTQYVRPLLDYPEYTNKYAREAKITIALHPKAKILRKRPDTFAASPSIASVPVNKTSMKSTGKVVEEKVRKRLSEKSLRPVVSPESLPSPSPLTTPITLSAPIIASVSSLAPQLVLELTPAIPFKRRLVRQR